MEKSVKKLLQNTRDLRVIYAQNSSNGLKSFRSPVKSFTQAWEIVAKSIS